jgi:hypothetical protein
LAKRGRKARAAQELGDDMEATLVFGGCLAEAFRGGKPEPPIEAQREAWSKHRAKLMKPENTDVGPGCRPAGWWRFEAHVDPVPERHCDQIPRLVQLGLIDAAEAAQIEHQHRELAPPTTPPRVTATGPYSDTAREDQVTDPDIRRHMRSRRLAVAKCAVVWHRWRGRPERAASWARTVAALEAALAEERSPA